MLPLSELSENILKEHTQRCKKIFQECVLSFVESKLMGSFHVVVTDITCYFTILILIPFSPPPLQIKMSCMCSGNVYFLLMAALTCTNIKYITQQVTGIIV